MNVLAICATAGRHHCVERALRMFLNQDYPNKYLLIYQNSEVYQELADFEGKDRVILINQHIDSVTRESYKTLGAIYNDAITYIPENIDVITFQDDDDIFLPNHLSEGIEGYERAVASGRIAYKPIQSYYRHREGIALIGNNLEPSVFVDVQHIKKYGFSLTTTEQHLQWFHPLLDENQILIDIEGIPTLVYNWGDNFPTFKTSGDYTNVNNFDNYRNSSRDHGDGVITPLQKSEVDRYYAEIDEFVNGKKG